MNNLAASSVPSLSFISISTSFWIASSFILFVQFLGFQIFFFQAFIDSGLFLFKEIHLLQVLQNFGLWLLDDRISVRFDDSGILFTSTYIDLKAVHFPFCFILYVNRTSDIQQPIIKNYIFITFSDKFLLYFSCLSVKLRKYCEVNEKSSINLS